MGMYTVPAWAMLAEQTARTAAAARLFALGLIKSLSPLRLYRHVAGIPNPNTIFAGRLWGRRILFPTAIGDGGPCCRGRESTPPGMMPRGRAVWPAALGALALAAAGGHVLRRTALAGAPAEPAAARARPHALRADPDSPRPNVVLVSIDSLRADPVGPYG